MASGTVDGGILRNILAIMNENCPDVDEGEEYEVGKFVKGEDEGKEVVRERLQVSVNGVKRVRRKWRRHDPLVMRLMQTLVQKRVVQSTVDRIDSKVGECDKKRVLQIEIFLAVLERVPVKFAVTVDLG